MPMPTQNQVDNISQDGAQDYCVLPHIQVILYLTLRSAMAMVSATGTVCVMASSRHKCQGGRSFSLCLKWVKV